MAGMHCTLQRKGVNGRADGEVNPAPILNQTATSQRGESGLSDCAGQHYAVEDKGR